MVEGGRGVVGRIVDERGKDNRRLGKLYIVSTLAMLTTFLQRTSCCDIASYVYFESKRSILGTSE